MGSKSFSKRRLNLARAHSIRVPHGSPQVFGAIGIPNLANLLLALVWRRKITRRTPATTAKGLPSQPPGHADLESSASLPFMHRPMEREDLEEPRMIKRRRERMNKTMREARPQPNMPYIQNKERKRSEEEERRI